jgi:hypothetical protein
MFGEPRFHLSVALKLFRHLRTDGTDNRHQYSAADTATDDLR